MSEMSGKNISNKVVASNLASDLERGRQFPCSLTEIFDKFNVISGQYLPKGVRGVIDRVVRLFSL